MYMNIHTPTHTHTHIHSLSNPPTHTHTPTHTCPCLAETNDFRRLFQGEGRVVKDGWGICVAGEDRGRERKREREGMETDREREIQSWSLIPEVSLPSVAAVDHAVTLSRPTLHHFYTGPCCPTHSWQHSLIHTHIHTHTRTHTYRHTHTHIHTYTQQFWSFSCGIKWTTSKTESMKHESTIYWRTSVLLWINTHINLSADEDIYGCHSLMHIFIFGFCGNKDMQCKGTIGELREFKQSDAFWQIKAARRAKNPVFMTLYPVAHPVTECGQYVVRHGVTGKKPWSLP